MNEAFVFEQDMEPERYELDEAAPYQFELDRREFIQRIGAGLVVLLLVERASAQQPNRGRRGGGGRGGPQDIGAYLHIAENGQITVYSGKVEIGQNIRTSLTQVVADELSVPLNSIHMIMADTQLTPNEGGTSGSRTTPDSARRLRQVAAAALQALIDLAAEQWKADRSLLSVSDGKIVHAETKQTLDFGQLTKGQKLTKTVTGDITVTAPNQWRVTGTSTPKVDGRDFVTGKHQYASDVRLPGMLHGKVLRPAAFGATLADMDAKAAEAIPDVVVVRDGDFVGVAATTEMVATQALGAIQANWTTTTQPSQRELFEQLKQPGAGGGGGPGGGRGGNRAGSIKEGLEKSDVRTSQSYTIAYIAHVPLEPRAAVAQWENDKLTVWTGTQQPFSVRGQLAGAFRVAEENVRVIVPDMGSGYGGKHSGECAVEAARLARAAHKPVKLVWTREEEFTWAYFRPAGVIDVKSGAGKDGTLLAWEFHNYNSGASAIGTLYEVPNQQIEFHSSRAPLRQGSYRALASTANVFARETNMDELAHALKVDPLEFRLKNLKDERLRAVFEAAAKAFGWGKPVAEGHGVGIGGGSEKASYVATCAEVAVDRATGRVKVIRTATAFECGAVVNPDHLKNQVEGAIVMGLGGALFEAIEFENGKILNPNFSRYRLPRFSDTPQIDVVLLDRKDLPSVGAGETPIVGIAPAIGNAIFAATGVRLRSLPLAPHGVKV